MTKNKKSVYETPVIMPLGELTRGLGAPCRPGSVATGKCIEGAAVPPPGCGNGNRAGGACNKGNRVGR